MTSARANTKHTLSVLVENKPGVLARIAGLFSRRGFNIDSLAVGPTEHPRGLPDDDRGRRRGLAARAGDQAAQQAGRGHQDRRARRLLLDQPRAPARQGQGRRRDAAARCWTPSSSSGPKVVDIAPDAVTIQAVGNADKLGDLLRVLEPFGIRELVQSGMVAIGRGSRSISERNLRPVTIPAPPAVGG